MAQIKFTKDASKTILNIAGRSAIDYIQINTRLTAIKGCELVSEPHFAVLDDRYDVCYIRTHKCRIGIVGIVDPNEPDIFVVASFVPLEQFNNDTKLSIANSAATSAGISSPSIFVVGGEEKLEWV